MRSDHLRRRILYVCAPLVAAAALTAVVAARLRPLLDFDGRVARGLHAHAVTHPGFTHVMRVLTDWVWDPWAMRALAGAACLWMWWRGEGRCALRIATATLAASVVGQGLKAWVGRERPVWPDPVDSAHYAAYPSGHALTATVVCGLLVWLVPRGSARPLARSARTVALLVAALSVLGVGFTRMYLGVHWFSDVLAGWLLGAALVALAVFDGACPGRSPVSPRAGGPVR